MVAAGALIPSVTTVVGISSTSHRKVGASMPFDVHQGGSDADMSLKDHSNDTTEWSMALVRLVGAGEGRATVVARHVAPFAAGNCARMIRQRADATWKQPIREAKGTARLVLADDAVQRVSIERGAAVNTSSAGSEDPACGGTCDALTTPAWVARQTHSVPSTRRVIISQVAGRMQWDPALAMDEPPREAACCVTARRISACAMTLRSLESSVLFSQLVG
mmetsp:Transcript_13207/g.40108  ORF Transcript_13207/g.40108 Transcript_13207/m.40108 type:complete len:220 (-) Transcript_13207:4116-4775(-)|eukprot:scaffold126648_cov31-Tisochrysis_lutea.AAC.5